MISFKRFKIDFKKQKIELYFCDYPRPLEQFNHKIPKTSNRSTMHYIILLRRSTNTCPANTNVTKLKPPNFKNTTIHVATTHWTPSSSNGTPRCQYRKNQQRRSCLSRFRIWNLSPSSPTKRDVTHFFFVYIFDFFLFSKNKK